MHSKYGLYNDMHFINFTNRKPLFLDPYESWEKEDAMIRSYRVRVYWTILDTASFNDFRTVRRSFTERRFRLPFIHAHLPDRLASHSFDLKKIQNWRNTPVKIQLPWQNQCKSFNRLFIKPNYSQRMVTEKRKGRPYLFS